jgi:glycosyltransferase involved in cell wall biosynthesis
MLKKVNAKILFVVFFDPQGLSTIKDNIEELVSLSKFQIEILNLFPNLNTYLTMPADIDLRQYAAIIIHPAVAYSPENLASLDQNLKIKFKDYAGVKILMKQDEQVYTYETARLIKSRGFDLILTCLAPSERHKAYPVALTGNIDFFQTLTGYVSPFLRNVHEHFMPQNREKIVYRGSIQPLVFGRLGVEKRKIGYDFLKKCEAQNITCDISSRWEDRIHGHDWFHFLSNAKAVLGVESGANIFDFEGQIQKECAIFMKNNSSLTLESEEIYNKAHKEFLHFYEDNVLYNQISPRHLEVAAVKTPQILYEGEYSNIFKPWQHYLPLKKDMSNFEEILEALNDSQKMNEMTTRAYEDIILNKDYHSETFAEQLDQKIDSLIEAKNMTTQKDKKRPSKKALILVPENPLSDPRISWFSSMLHSLNYETCVLGIDFYQRNKIIKLLKQDKQDVLFLNVSGDYDEDVFTLDDILKINRDALFWYYELEKTNKHFQDIVGKHKVENTDRFSWLNQHFLKVNKSFFEHGLKLEHFDCVIACDLNSLLAGVLLSQKFDVPLIYDAHEYWPFADIQFYPWENAFFQAMEKDLLRFVDLAITVTPQLAEAMGKAYDKTFLSLPNAEPISLLKQVTPAFAQDRSSDVCRFLFQGGYSLGRGIEALIRLWKNTPQNVHLYLRGPHNHHTDEFMKIAEELGLLDKRVFFLDKVTEDELTTSASEFDVGVIPYDPHVTINHEFCCPNKLSQYMAAGLPLLTNDLVFVKEQILEAGCGFSVDFRHEQTFLEAVKALMDSKLRNEMGRKAQHYFMHHHNWDVLSGPISQQIDKLVPQPKNPQPFNFDFLQDYKVIENAQEIIYQKKINPKKMLCNFFKMLRYDNSAVQFLYKVKYYLKHKKIMPYIKYKFKNLFNK